MPTEAQRQRYWDRAAPRTDDATQFVLDEARKHDLEVLASGRFVRGVVERPAGRKPS